MSPLVVALFGAACGGKAERPHARADGDADTDVDGEVAQVRELARRGAAASACVVIMSMATA
jgi:hypothetical protein